METNRNTLLIQGVSQFEVDFVIPRLGRDLPLGIDPFLLFKSRDAILQSLHTTILTTFNHGIDLVRQNRIADARHLFTFPEVAEIGLGYAHGSKQGSGVGRFLTELIIETLVDSPALLERGIRHVEEMQLVAVGVGPDRVSDIAASLIKQYLIEYTQKQADLWTIPLIAGVPVNHILDPATGDWFDGYFDLPVSQFDSSPIILVPRRIVRSLPWINYDDFLRTELTSYLRAKRVREKLAGTRGTEHSQEPQPSKEQVVTLNRSELARVDSYVTKKEAAADSAQPSLTYIDASGTCPETDRLKTRLAEIHTGTEQASDFQRVVLEILNFLFVPELIDGELEVRTVEGTERRDIIFTNDSDRSFWEYVRNEHSGIFLMFETKNTKSIEISHLNQTATYLGDRIGRLGFIVTRFPLEKAQEKKVFAIYNDSHPRKVILVLSDVDLNIMLDMKCAGQDPMRYLQKLYRDFRTRVQ